MKFNEFRDIVKKYPLFRSSLFAHITQSPNILRRQVSEWVKKGYLEQLKRGIYTLSNDERPVHFSIYFLANYLYRPSYISLESALSYYGIIPERVKTITSITSKKTQFFHNRFGEFKYHHIKPEWFSNFIELKDEYGQSFYMASKERALIDFFYFKIKKIEMINEDIFELSYRFQNLADLDIKKLKAISLQLNNKKVNYIVKLFTHYWNNHHARDIKK